MFDDEGKVRCDMCGEVVKLKRGHTVRNDSILQADHLCSDCTNTWAQVHAQDLQEEKGRLAIYSEGSKDAQSNEDLR